MQREVKNEKERYILEEETRMNTHRMVVITKLRKVDRFTEKHIYYTTKPEDTPVIECSIKNPVEDEDHLLEVLLTPAITLLEKEKRNDCLACRLL